MITPIPYLSKIELEDFFQDITTQMLGFDPTLPENQSLVRISREKSGMPAFGIDEDICFITLIFTDDVVTKYRDISYQNPTDPTLIQKTTKRCIVAGCQWVFYGPNGYINSRLVQDNLFEAEYISQCKAVNLALTHDLDEPITFREQYNDQYWERTDFSAMFNEAVVLQSQLPAIAGVNIKIKTDTGLEKDVNINN